VNDPANRTAVNMSGVPAELQSIYDGLLGYHDSLTASSSP